MTDTMTMYTCANCNEQWERPSNMPGRKPKYCSTRCKSKAQREASKTVTIIVTEDQQGRFRRLLKKMGVAR